MSPRTVLFFGSYDAGLHPRVAVLRDGLAENGWVVGEMNVPLGASTADKVAAVSSARAAAGLLARQARSWRRLVRQARGSSGRVPEDWVPDDVGAGDLDAGALGPDDLGPDDLGPDGRGGPDDRGAGEPDVVVVGYLGHADVHLARALFRRSTIVLDHLVDLADTLSDRGLGGPAMRRVMAAADRAALRAADVVLVDTEQQAERLPEPARAKAVVVPVGAGRNWSQAGRASRAGDSPAGGTRSPLRVVFFGLFTPLQGAGTIARAIRLLHGEDFAFTLVGRGQDWELARGLVGEDDRVRWLDWVEPGELPALVADHDVALGIFGTGPKAARVVPTKVYQGMAAGCATVTAATPAVAGLDVLTVRPGDPEALADALRRLNEHRDELALARRRCRAQSERFTPPAATAALDARLRAIVPPAGPLPALTMNAWLRWDVIARVLADRRLVDVLEIGPGEGAAACRLARGHRYTGVEPSARTRAMTGRRLAAHGTPGRLLASLDELAEGERFDLVCAFEVIEHIDDDRAALGDWAARVRSGGTLILSTPAGPERMGPHDVIAGHFRRYTPDGLAGLAVAAGLVDVQVVHTGFPVGYALEAVRNRLAARRLARGEASGDAARLTEQSSSILQPPAWSGILTKVGSAPFRVAQRTRPDRGTGLVLVARAP